MNVVLGKSFHTLSCIHTAHLKKQSYHQVWWRTPLIPALGRQRQGDFWVWGQPGLQSEFQDSQGYTEKPCLRKPKKKKKNKNKNQNQSYQFLLMKDQ